MASVLEGFLVSLGFDIDKDGLAKFNGIVQQAGERFVQIGKAAVGAGVAIGTAFAATTSEINDLYKVSNNTGTSIKGLMTLQGAVERVGGSAEDVSTAFNEFALKSKIHGRAFEQMVGQQLGVSLRKANGEARDMSDVFIDASKKLADLAKVDPGLARAKAEAIGLGAIFDDIVKGDFPAELERSARYTDLFGKEIDKGADASHRLMNEIGQVWDTVKMGAMSATAQITDALGLDKKLEKFNMGFADFLKSTIDSQVQIIKDASGFFDWVGKVLFDSGDYYDDSRRKVLKERIDSGKATDEEKEEYKSLVKDKKANDDADSAGIDREVVKQNDLGGKMDDSLALKAAFFGVDKSDSKAMEELKTREITAADLAQADEEGDTERYKLGLQAMKVQAKEKSSAEKSEPKQEAPAQKTAKPDEKPAEAKLTTKPEAPVKEAPKLSEALSQGIKKLGEKKPELTVEVSEVEKSPPMSGSPLAKEAANAAAGAKAAGDVTDNSDHSQTTTQTVTYNVEQHITIDGSKDPKATGQAVADATQSLDRQNKRGIV